MRIHLHVTRPGFENAHLSVPQFRESTVLKLFEPLNGLFIPVRLLATSARTAELALFGFASNFGCCGWSEGFVFPFERIWYPCAKRNLEFVWYLVRNVIRIYFYNFYNAARSVRIRTSRISGEKFNFLACDSSNIGRPQGNWWIW